MLTFLRHAAGAVSRLREARRARKRPARLPGRRPVADEEIAAALRDWAGDAL